MHSDFRLIVQERKNDIKKYEFQIILENQVKEDENEIHSEVVKKITQEVNTIIMLVQLLSSITIPDYMYDRLNNVDQASKLGKDQCGKGFL